MELSIGMDDEPAESLWVLADKPMWITTDLMNRKKPHVHRLWSSWGTLNTPICAAGAAQRDKSNQGGFLLECIDSNFQTQVTEKPMKECALWELILTSKQELVRNVKVRSDLGCSHFETVGFRILKGMIKANSRITILKFKRADFGLFTDLLERIPRDSSLARRGIQETWMTFQELPAPISRMIHSDFQENKQGLQEACMDE